MDRETVRNVLDWYKHSHPKEMSEPKYKDADELLKRLNSCKYPAEKPTMRQATYNAAISDACRIVDAIPAANVVEVCRCEHCFKSIEHPNGRWCKVFQTVVQNSDYCSQWARKDG